MVHRSWMKNQGLPHHLFDGRPVIYDHVNQADQGVDLDFLVGKSGAPVPRESH